MQMKNNKLDKYRELLVDKLNKKSFPVLYSFAECVRTNNEYSAIIYINSILIARNILQNVTEYIRFINQL